VFSEKTNKKILDLGVKYCVDEACLPIKIFHGHVASLKDRCDLIIVPRIMKEKGGEFICPKFCGLPEMIDNSIPDLPDITRQPVFMNQKKSLDKWVMHLGKSITKSKGKIMKAYEEAAKVQKSYKTSIDKNYSYKIALVGHPYCVHDSFFNMNIIKKLNKMGVGGITEEKNNNEFLQKEIKNLYKKPFWDFTKNSYGFCMDVLKNHGADGIIYVSSFGCGIDSVSIELIKNQVNHFPFLVLKIDEHTGEAGVDTRIEAFINMLEERRDLLGDNISPFRKHLYTH
jgi:predicted nucleotide-binding protein (sugar kinase/HSP70/actin superfamily)